MTKWTVTVYTNEVDAQAAMALIDNTTYAELIPYAIGGNEYWLVVNAGTGVGMPVSIISGTINVASGTFTSSITNIGITPVDQSSGVKSLGTQRMTLATDDVNMVAFNAILGAVGDAIVAAGAAGSISAKLRRISADVGTLITTVGTPGAVPPAAVVVVAGSDATDVRTLLTDTDGTLKADITKIAGTAPTTAGKFDVKSADGDLPSIGAIADAAVVAGASGSLSAKIRRVSADLATLLSSIGTPAAVAPATVMMVGGTDGTDARGLRTDPAGNLYVIPNAHGFIPGSQEIIKMGYIEGVNNAFQDIWTHGGTYVWPVAQQQMEVVSSSANDTAAGTGARSITFVYLDNTFAQHTETVTLNGVTPVLTVATNIYRINSFLVATAGSDKVADGNIDIRNATDHATVYSEIMAGYNRDRNSMITVPAGKTLYIEELSFSAASDGGTFTTRFTLEATYNDVTGVVTTLFYPYAEYVTLYVGQIDVFAEPLKLPAGTDLRIRVVTSNDSSNSTANVVYRGWWQ
jgi:hypothetical protein